MVAHVAEEGEVTVPDLANKFNVSVDTVRRDLDQLDAEGLLIRTHGGAISNSSFPTPDSAMDLRLRVQRDAKEVIGKLAATLVSDNSTIIINSGTTSLALVRHLADHRDLTIATNNLRIPGEIHPEIFRDLYLFGGSIRLISQATIGPITLMTPSGRQQVNLACDSAFVGVGAISLEQGFSTSNLAEAAMMTAMMDSAETVIILADSSKFGRKLFARICGFERVDYLVTDRPPEPDFSEALAKAGVRILTP